MHRDVKRPDIVRGNSYYLGRFNGAYKKSSISGWTCMGQTLECFQCLPSPENWAWQNEKENGNWKPKWTTSTAVTASCQELLKCGCKKSNCVGNCKCYRAGLSWSGLCT